MKNLKLFLEDYIRTISNIFLRIGMGILCVLALAILILIWIFVAACIVTPFGLALQYHWSFIFTGAITWYIGYKIAVKLEQEST